MRNRTRVIAAAVVAVALAAGSTAAAVAAPTGGKPSAPAVAKTPPPVKTPSAVKTPVPDNGLADLAAKLGVAPARLDQALRTVKTSLGTSGTPPTEDQFTAALARALGIPVARVRQAFPAGALGGNKVVKDKKPGGSGTANPAVDAALAAAVARELQVSTARVNAALRPLFAAGRADPSSPAFAAAARSLGVSVQQLTTALVHAKMSLAKGK
jgi:hypothetical protein